VLVHRRTTLHPHISAQNTVDNPDFLVRRSIDLLKEDPKAAKAAFKASAAAHCPHCGVKHRLLTPDQCLDRKMSERTLQDRIRNRARTRGWKVAHSGKGIAAFDAAGAPVFVTPMAKGWPDLVLAKPGHRVIFMELKKEQGVVEPEQHEWLDLLNQTGNFAIVVRPSDLREGRVNVILNEGAPL
jgi:hypothetical protein